MRIFVVSLVAAAILAPACDKDGSSPSAPTAQTLEGTWRATKVSS
jgi:hypothetical protein